MIPLSERKTNNREQLTKDEFTKMYLVTELDDIVYNPANVKYGAIDRNKCGRGLISPIYVTFTTSEIPGFIECIVTSHDFQQRALRFEEGTVTKRQSVNPEDFVTIDILVAPQKEEQRKISEYFDCLDHLITLHQCKCDNTKIIIYIAWEQRKFNDIASRESIVQTSSEEFPSIEYEDVIAEEGRLNKDIYLKASEKSGIVFDGSQVLYGKLRPYLHNWLNPDFKGVAVGDWWVLNPNDIDKNFLYRLIQSSRFDNIANQSSGSKMPRADWNLISNSEFLIPLSKEEQNKIGAYFDNLDNLITLHQQKYIFAKYVSKYAKNDILEAESASVGGSRTSFWKKEIFNMGMMTVYHGGYKAVEQPEIRKGRNTKDFGTGFYCTIIKEQAQRWARRYDTKVVSIYDVRMEADLNIKEFKEMTEEWLDFIVACRSGLSHDYDIVIGAMADDQIYNYVSDYMDGVITREQFWVLAKFKYPTHQIAFCTERSLKCLEYRDCEVL